MEKHTDSHMELDGNDFKPMGISTCENMWDFVTICGFCGIS